MTTNNENHQTTTTITSKNPAIERTSSTALFTVEFLVMTQLEKKIGKFELSIVKVSRVPTIFTYKLMIP